MLLQLLCLAHQRNPKHSGLPQNALSPEPQAWGLGSSPDAAARASAAGAQRTAAVEGFRVLRVEIGRPYRNDYIYRDIYIYICIFFDIGKRLRHPGVDINPLASRPPPRRKQT